MNTQLPQGGEGEKIAAILHVSAVEELEGFEDRGCRLHAAMALQLELQSGNPAVALESVQTRSRAAPQSPHGTSNPPPPTGHLVAVPQSAMP